MGGNCQRIFACFQKGGQFLKARLCSHGEQILSFIRRALFRSGVCLGTQTGCHKIVSFVKYKKIYKVCVCVSACVRAHVFVCVCDSENTIQDL